MNQLVTEAIVLKRLNYGEADRIVTVLTPEQGKLSLVARGVRRPKSKLAGGIELFSISSLTYLKGRSDLSRLISARLERHYGNIVQALDRVQLGYELIKQLDRATEDNPEPEYFYVLDQALQALNTAAVSTELIRFWFGCQLLHFSGEEPNLREDIMGQPLQADQRYQFDLDNMAFAPARQRKTGHFAADHIKVLRLCFTDVSPATLQHIAGLPVLLKELQPLQQSMLASHIRA